MDLQNAVVLVTGAGSGIGRASAFAFARAGARAVVAADVDESDCAEISEEIRGQGAIPLFIRTDVADQNSVQDLFTQIATQFGRLDVVHNCAGITLGSPGWPNVPLSRIAQVIAVNLTGTLAVTRLAIEAMAEHGGGSIINTASIAAVVPMGDDPVYASTKAAVVHFTHSCASLSKTHGVRVNAILPGIVDTPMLAKTGDGVQPAPWVTAMLPHIVPLEPRQVAERVVEIALSDDVGETVTIENDMREPTPTSHVD